MGDIGKVDKSSLGGVDSGNSLSTLVENALHGDSQALQKLYVEFDERLRQFIRDMGGLSKATNIESIIKSTKELANLRIQKVLDQEGGTEAEGEEGDECKLPLGYPQEEKASLESFYAWLQICYLDIHFQNLLEGFLEINGNISCTTDLVQFISLIEKCSMQNAVLKVPNVIVYAKCILDKRKKNEENDYRKDQLFSLDFLSDTISDKSFCVWMKVCFFNVRIRQLSKRLSGFIRIIENCHTQEADSIVRDVINLVEDRIRRVVQLNANEEEASYTKALTQAGFTGNNDISNPFFAWLKTCYFDRRIQLLSNDYRKSAKDLSSDKIDITNKLHAVVTQFFSIYIYRNKHKYFKSEQLRDKDSEDIIQKSLEVVWSKLTEKEYFDPNKGTLLNLTNGVVRTIWKKAIAGEINESKKQDSLNPYRSMTSEYSDRSKLEDADENKSVTSKLTDTNYPDKPIEPPEVAEMLEEYLLLLRIICQHTRYPHKQFAFLFSHVIEGDNGRGNPLEVVQKYSEILFDGPTGETKKSLYQTYKYEYCRQSQIFDPDVLFKHCLPLEHLRSKLYSSVYENVKVDERNVERFKHFLTLPTALTRMHDYLQCYKRKHHEVIAQWCDDIKNEVRECL